MNRSSLPVAAFAAALVATTGAGAQSDSDLRLENQRLRTRVGDLERELEAARHRIDELEQALEALRQLAPVTPPQPATGPDAPPPEEVVTVDESVPNASPRALLAALAASYEEAVGDMDLGEPGGRQRTAYLRQVRNWVSRVNRELRSQIDWHVLLLLPDRQDADPTLVRVQAVDPETGVRLGDPVPIVVPPAVRRRLAQYDQRGQLDVMVLYGVLNPNVIFNQDRTAEGPFNSPRFIGPFAEVDPVIQVHGIKPAEKAEEKGGARDKGTEGLRD